MYRFVVRDYGIGMSEEFLQHIFEPFVREQDARVSRIAGTGLGLPISKSIVEQMGGTLSVTSRVNQGTTVVICVPLMAQENQPQFGQFTAQKVLVIDDYEERDRSIGKLLQGSAIRMEYADTEAGALKLLRQAKQDKRAFTCIIVDHAVSNGNGMDFVRTIRREYDRNLPIMIASMSDDPEMEEEAQRAGVNWLLKKPVFRSGLSLAFHHIMETGEQSVCREECVDNSGKLKLHVLVAEDNYVNSEIAIEIFKYLGLQATIVANGKDAVARLEEEPRGTYDCVFLDLQMPVMDGFSAARIIRRSYSAKELPIFAMTANVFTEDVAYCREAGMQEHIGKPVSMEQIRQILEKYFAE